MEALVTALTSGLQDIAADMLGIVAAVTPVALGVVGAVLVVRFGIKTFRNVTSG